MRSQDGTPPRVLLGALIVAAMCAASTRPSPATDAGAISSSSAPAPDDSAAWRWAMAAPGMNIYVSYRHARLEGSIVTAWIDREYYRNPAGIDKSIIELMQFDCARMATRRLTAVTSRMSAWQQQQPGSLVGRIGLEVCLKMNAQVPKVQGPQP